MQVIEDSLNKSEEIEDDEKNNLGDFIEDKNTLRPDQLVEREIVKENLEYILDMLDEREVTVIKMRYGLDRPTYTLEQVGEELQITRERVRQIEQKVIQKLKGHIGMQRILGIEDDIEKMEFREKTGKNKKREAYLKSLKINIDNDDKENDDNDDFDD